MTLIKVSINWQKRTDGFWQLIETSNNGILGFLKVLINWKDQVKFDQLTKNKLKKFWSNAQINRNFRSTENVKWNSIKWSFPSKPDKNKSISILTGRILMQFYTSRCNFREKLIWGSNSGKSLILGTLLPKSWESLCYTIFLKHDKILDSVNNKTYFT